MKFILYLFAFFTLGTCATHQRPRPMESKLLFQKNVTYDFGVIKYKTMVEHQFTFRNPTTSKIVVNEVKVGCNCISVETTKRVVMPNDTFHVFIKLNLKKIDGYFDKTVMVYINNGEYYLMPRVVGFSKSK